MLYPRWTYREDARGRAIIPRGKSIDQFLDELTDLVSTCCPSVLGHSTIVVIREDLAEGAVIREGSTRRVASHRWKTIVEHSLQVSILRGSVRLLSGRSSLDTTWVGLGSSAIESAVSSHAQKVCKYRGNLNGGPVWLVVHSDGHPHSGLVPPHLLDNACEAARFCLDGLSSRFDAAFWFDKPTRLGGGDLLAIDASARDLLRGAQAKDPPGS